MSISAFGVDHGEISKGVGGVARKLGVAHTWKPTTKVAPAQAGHEALESKGTWALKPAYVSRDPGSKNPFNGKIANGGLTMKGYAAGGARDDAAAHLEPELPDPVGRVIEAQPGAQRVVT